MSSGQEIAGELVVSGGDAAEVLKPAEAALDYISASVSRLVEAMDHDAVGFVGDYRLGAAAAISARRLSPSYPLSARSALMGGASAKTSGAAAMSAS
jgi:hypothetical protein